MTQDHSQCRTTIPSLNIGPADTPPDIITPALSHFNSIPWTSSLLNKPSVIPVVLQCRNQTCPETDQLFGSTLTTARTIPHMLSFFTKTDKNVSDPTVLVEEVSTLYQLGSGMTGGTSILHGGMTMTLVDEAMGALPELNYVLGKYGDSFKTLSVTGTLEIQFLRPIFTEGTVVVTAWLEGVERRKTRIRCEIKDGEGQVLVKCSSIWISPKARI